MMESMDREVESNFTLLEWQMAILFANFECQYNRSQGCVFHFRKYNETDDETAALKC